MARLQLYYLGPEGTFTHQAALDAAGRFRMLGDFDLVAMPDIPSIMAKVEARQGWGVIAWESNVEGYVVPNLDMLIDSVDVAGCARISVDVAFNAFVREHPAAADYDGRRISAHEVGLAQCKRYIAKHHFQSKPAVSNAAACRDLEPGNIALGPSICGELYGLTTLAEHVQDFEGAHTEFLVITPRDTVRDLSVRVGQSEMNGFETILCFIPLVTGPGVLANVLDLLRDAGLNMTSFISRPIKGHDGTYSFIATLDAAPWEPRFHSVIEEIAEHGDWIKTLAVYPRRERPNPPVNAWMLPAGGVNLEPDRVPDHWQSSDAARKELLW